MPEPEQQSEHLSKGVSNPEREYLLNQAIWETVYECRTMYDRIKQNMLKIIIFFYALFIL